jgi:hypothetical protein
MCKYIISVKWNYLYTLNVSMRYNRNVHLGARSFEHSCGSEIYGMVVPSILLRIIIGLRAIVGCTKHVVLTRMGTGHGSREMLGMVRSKKDVQKDHFTL